MPLADLAGRRSLQAVDWKYDLSTCLHKLGPHLQVGTCGAVCDSLDSRRLASNIVRARSDIMPESNEFVVRYSKKMTLDSSAFCAQSSSCALVDILNFDLSFISRCVVKGLYVKPVDAG